MVDQEQLGLWLDKKLGKGPKPRPHFHWEQVSLFKFVQNPQEYAELLSPQQLRLLVKAVRVAQLSQSALLKAHTHP